MATSLTIQGTNTTLVVVETNQTLVSSGSTVVIDSGSGAIGPTGSIGPTGPTGPAGPIGGRYVHTQASAATVWTVPHNLGFRPVVSVLTVGGVEILGGEVLHLSLNTLTITFDVAFAGSAALV